jgi:hypothetical protein
MDGISADGKPENLESGKYDEPEAQKRFERLVKAALQTSPTRRKETPAKSRAQSKKRRNRATKASRTLSLFLLSVLSPTSQKPLCRETATGLIAAECFIATE